MIASWVSKSSKNLVTLYLVIPPRKASIAMMQNSPKWRNQKFGQKKRPENPTVP
jgi:hypothetical protein